MGEGRRSEKANAVGVRDVLGFVGWRAKRKDGKEF